MNTASWLDILMGILLGVVSSLLIVGAYKIGERICK